MSADRRQGGAPWDDDDDPSDCETNPLTDAEYGLDNREPCGSNDGGSGGSRRSARHANSPSSSCSQRCTSSPSSTRCRWLALTSLGVGLVLYSETHGWRSRIELQSIKGVMRGRGANGGGRGGYEPLVGWDGGAYGKLGTTDEYAKPTYIEEGYGDGDDEDGNAYDEPASQSSDGEVFTDRASISKSSTDFIHPRTICFDPDDCQSTLTVEVNASDMPHSIPTKPRSKPGKPSSSKDYTDVFESETSECKLSAPYQSRTAAPSTCNDMHALGFRFGPSEHEPLVDRTASYPSTQSVKYLTSGGFRSVYTVTQTVNAYYHDDRGAVASEAGSRVIMKTNQLRRGWGPYYLDQNRRDVLISERAGGSPHTSNLLPVYQYCAFSSVVPFASAGVLDDYMYDRHGDLLDAAQQYDLALQAARGLSQAHLFAGGRATMAHADVKPPQFLLFDLESTALASVGGGNVTAGVPIMQINDFNRGQFLTRSSKTNETCPFQMCNVHHKGSLYRSPEEYMKCADQSDKIDVYSLGGVFYYLLSDGEKPWYYVHDYDKAVKKILNGEKPRLPNPDEYKHYGDDVVKMVAERSTHPAFRALKEVMWECWKFKPKDRPSSLQVVNMLEERWREISSGERSH